MIVCPACNRKIYQKFGLLSQDCIKCMSKSGKAIVKYSPRSRLGKQTDIRNIWGAEKTAIILVEPCFSMTVMTSSELT